MRKFFGRLKIKYQLLLVYVMGILLPIVLVGGYSLWNTANQLNSYYVGLNQSNNNRIKSILQEITTQFYSISMDICNDPDLQQLLSVDADFNYETFARSMIQFHKIDDILERYNEIEDITILMDNEYLTDYGYVRNATEEEKASTWYNRTLGQYAPYWVTSVAENSDGEPESHAFLVSRIQLDTEKDAVLVMTLSRKYLRERIYTEEYEAVVMLEDGSVFYCDSPEWLDEAHSFIIAEEDARGDNSARVKIADTSYLASYSYISATRLANKLYISSMYTFDYDNVSSIIRLSFAIVIAAMVFPLIILAFFGNYFTSRVRKLREAMNRVSGGDYSVPESLDGQDEISQAYGDLKEMVSTVQEKDALFYEAKLNEQKLLNEQQIMEFKMLSNQLNPHFLYNTLETIRMRAFTAGDRDVATAVKHLGKLMRYVLENSKTTAVTLRRELDYMETYLQIQKLRFADRINYIFLTENGLDTEELQVLPLLLQPIVENAIVHGLDEVEHEGMISIEIARRGEDKLAITISDNGCGMSDKELLRLNEKISTPHKDLKKSIGLYNTNQRIKLCYGEQYGLNVQSALNEGTSITVLLPLIRAR